MGNKCYLSFFCVIILNNRRNKTMNLRNLEFFKLPEGKLMVKEDEKFFILTPQRQALIKTCLEKIKREYPLAYDRLEKNYKIHKSHSSFYEFIMVMRFLSCNCGSHDTREYDIDSLGFFNFEEVKCPLRGLCPDENIICKPSLAITLSSREYVVFRLIAEGLSTKDIAHKLYISPNTVKRHRENIKNKTNCNTSTQLVTFFFRHKLNLESQNNE